MQVLNTNSVSKKVISHAMRGQGITKVYSADVRVDDAGLRKQIGSGFDGREEVFAHYPVHVGGGGVQYRDAKLNYLRTLDGQDWHTLFLEPAATSAIQQLGVAFFVKTNVGDYWLQDIGKDTRCSGGAFND